MSGFVTYQWQLLELIRGVHELPLVRPGSASVLRSCGDLWGIESKPDSFHRTQAMQSSSQAHSMGERPKEGHLIRCDISSAALNLN